MQIMIIYSHSLPEKHKDRKNHVTGVPPPVAAHAYKIVELEKLFVCEADGKFSLLEILRKY